MLHGVPHRAARVESMRSTQENMVKVFVAGATGVIGRLVRQLPEAGHEVTGMTRSSGHADALRQAGAEAVVCDAFDPEG